VSEIEPIVINLYKCNMRSKYIYCITNIWQKLYSGDSKTYVPTKDWCWLSRNEVYRHYPKKNGKNNGRKYLSFR